ncbi:hypothetical protein Hanom_Chr13g01192821 [Helianthus anomalus]
MYSFLNPYLVNRILNPLPWNNLLFTILATEFGPGIVRVGYDPYYSIGYCP